MSTRSLSRAPADAGEITARENARRLASRVLVELDFAGVIVTPRAFELWHIHLGGAAPQLSERIEALLRQSHAPSVAAIDALYAEHISHSAEEHSVFEDAETLQQEAQGIIEGAAGNGVGLRRYGEVLSDCSVRLRDDHSVTSFARTVAMLTAETVRASEQNRALEQQLSAATARVARLKDSLLDVKREATTDGLTGLCNRRAFDPRLRRAISTAKADGMPISVLLLDVDHFKRVNDTHGVNRPSGRRPGASPHWALAEREREGARHGGAIWRRGVRDYSCGCRNTRGNDCRRADSECARKQESWQERLGAGLGACDNLDRRGRASAGRYNRDVDEPRR